MSRYYFNESPQEIMWKDKCKMLEKENEKLKILNKKLEDLADKYFKISQKSRAYYEEKIEEFNSLPWWKKIWYWVH